MEKHDLGELATHCIRCGFCLESCPTFVLTGNELESPRGRIYLARSANEGKLEWNDIQAHMDLCLGCRACETACPSGVRYGEILELARDKIEETNPSPMKRFLLESTTKPALLRVQLAVGHLAGLTRMPSLLSRMISGQTPEADLPKIQPANTLPELDESQLPPIKGEIYFLEGCAMNVLFRRVNECSKRLLRRLGYSIRTVDQGCCGALHAHNGHLAAAENQAVKLMGAMSDDLPVVVNSAGCGSTMKDYRTLLNTETSARFSRRVEDLSEFLFARGFKETLTQSPGISEGIAYHEACHLVHGQKISEAPRELLRSIPNCRFCALAEADMCCGSAGIYNITQPKMARDLLERKWTNFAESGASILVSGNPGCHSWLAQANREDGNQARIFHTAECLEASFIGLDAFRS